MKIEVDELQNAGYEPFATLYLSDIAGFIKPYLSKKNIYVYSYYAASGIPLILFMAMMGFVLAKNQGVANFFSNFFLGFSFAFLLLPLHEYIHGLAYRYVGAKNISYGADWKKFVFYAVADKFVANYQEFKIVALAPFMVITFLGIVLFFVLPADWKYSMVGMIFLHSAFCGGDFGLLSFFKENIDKEIVTYDDVPNKISYFLVRK